MQTFLGIEYGRGCLLNAIDGGCALAPQAVQKMFPNADWEMVMSAPFDAKKCKDDRFGENFEIQKQIYDATDLLYKKGKGARNIMIGGDHSTNFGHFSAIADNIDDDLCLVYIDAHYDIHTPESACQEASGAPHGTNIRALMGTGDVRWLGLPKKIPALKPKNMFFLGTRSYEKSEDKFVTEQNIFNRSPDELKTESDWANAVMEIRKQINGRPFVLSFDFDSLDPNVFREVLVPAGGGISADTARFFLNGFKDAISFEFVEYAPNGCTKSATLVKELISIVFDG